jgi:hypothetical protein
VVVLREERAGEDHTNDQGPKISAHCIAV